MRRKLVDIKSLQLKPHPIIKTLTQDDLLFEYPIENLNILCPRTLHYLLEQIALPVTQEEHSNDEIYFLLKPDPCFEMLRNHSVVQTMKIQLLIYEVTEVEALINALLFEQTALNYLNASENWQNLHNRWQLRKKEKQGLLPLNELAKLANRKPSVLRKRQITNGI